ncbi:hypothetical protein DH2020_035553 [Rehmannia glutinosa]|uniref:Mannan endo-1,4-beta-mannosidase n=1 Tax=Rehmannia glutinosa TaxID=99300 RepID=A0ABR0V8Z5_REHGL
MSTGSTVIEQSIPPVRAVNLGGWLVTEGWIKPSLFDDIPNKDLLDGTSLQIKSVKTGKYLCAEKGGGTNIVANRTTADRWETFRLWRINETSFNFRVSNKQFMGVDTTGNKIDIIAVVDTPGDSETFEIIRDSCDKNRVKFKASNGYFLQVKTETLVTADYNGCDGWRNDNPSVFLLTINTNLHGEYQLTNGYGPELAPKVMKEHWDTFIVEEDFNFMKKVGLNAVRLPVGWWTTHDPNPSKPYVAGSLQYLDKAFTWAEKYGIKVILTLHAAPHSQSGSEPSSSRDGTPEWEEFCWERTHFKDNFHARDGFHVWGLNDDIIDETVAVIDFLTARLLKYYKDGYAAVRKHSPTAYVVLSDRMVQNEPRELFALAEELPRSVIDVHLYSLFDPKFASFTVEQNIEFVYNDRAKYLKKLTLPDGPLIFVGEWVAEWEVKNATDEQLKRFAEAQMQVYGRTTFGWAYWALKNENHEVDRKHWSLESMIKKGIVRIQPDMAKKSVAI